MMKTMRKNAKFILWFVLGAFLFTIVAVWGAKSAFLDPKSNPDMIAKVGKTEITYTALGQAWQSRLQQLYDQGIKVSEDKEKEMKKELLNAMIERQLQLDYAKKLNITTSPEEVAQSIMGIQAFNDKGTFNKDRYIQYLTSQRINADEFENEQRDTIIAAKLRNLLFANVKTTDDEIKAYFNKRERKIAVNYVYFNYKNFLSGIKIDEEKMKDYYAMNKKNYEKPDRVRASHILIRPDASPTSPTGRTDEAALKFAGELLAKIKAGESFETLAKKYSQDPGSGAKGGDLDWFSKGMMVPEFETAAFALKTGGVSGVIKTQFGYHIIKVTGHETGFEPTYDKVRSKVLEQMQKEEGLKLMKDKAQAMKDEIKAPDLFEKLAPKYNVSVLSSSITEETKSSALSKDFPDTMLDLNKNDVSGIITGDNGYYLAKITSESSVAFNEDKFKKKSDELTNKLRIIKFRQVQQDLIDKLKIDEKVQLFEKNI
jgi:peptidyl-prolyl cis-trans isomerase D